MVIRWSLPAQLQLKHIHDYISFESPYYAKKVTEDIILKSMTLRDFPKIGRIVPEMNQETIRELIIYSYRLIYQINNNDIDILTLVHGKQDFQGV